MFIKIVTLFLIALLCVSCGNAGYTLRLEGSKDGVGGAIEYTFNPAKSATAGFPVVEDNKGNTFFGIGTGVIDKISEQLEKLLGKPKVASVETKATQIEPIVRLVDLLNQLYKKGN